MNRLPLFLAVVCCFSISISAQSANFKAQGKYYSAKQALTDKNYSKAIDYIVQCKDLLGGGSNRQVEYVHILASNFLGEYVMAQTEMERFFRLIEKSEKEVSFDKSVEELTDDEVKAITKLIDPINESVERMKAGKETERVRKLKEPYDQAIRLLGGFSQKIKIFSDRDPYTDLGGAFNDALTFSDDFLECKSVITDIERSVKLNSYWHFTIVSLKRAGKKIPVTGIKSVSKSGDVITIKHDKVNASFSISATAYVVQDGSRIYRGDRYNPDSWWNLPYYLEYYGEDLCLNVDNSADYYNALKIILTGNPKFKGVFK